MDARGSVIAFGGIFFLTVVLVFASEIGGQGRKENDAVRCLRCHPNERGVQRLHQHPLIKEGQCKSCHSSYDEEMHQEREHPVLEVCLECHRDQLGRSHPVGGGIMDPNTSETMTCVSTCHRPHGTEYPHELPYANGKDLCLSCHPNY